MTQSVVIAPATGPGIGLGHLRRCEALCEAMEGSHLVLARDDDDWMSDIPTHATAVLDMLYHGNADRTVQAVAALRARGLKVAVIDSMPPDHYPDTAPPEAMPDWLITPYVAAHRLRLPPRTGTWLHGPDYAILSAAFADARAKLPADRPDRVLVACGAVDPGGLSRRVVEACLDGSLNIDLIIGPDFAPPLQDALEALAAGTPRLTLHHAPDSLLPLFLAAGLVVGRPGLIRYEAAALGRPALYLAEGSEYLDYFRAFTAAGIAEVFLASDPGGTAGFLDRIGALVAGDAGGLPPVPNRAALAAVDGRGARRVSLALSQS